MSRTKHKESKERNKSKDDKNKMKILRNEVFLRWRWEKSRRIPKCKPNQINWKLFVAYYGNGRKNIFWQKKTKFVKSSNVYGWKLARLGPYLARLGRGSRGNQLSKHLVRWRLLEIFQLGTFFSYFCG